MRKSTASILLLFTLSGTSALVYQIVWIRMLSHLLGGTTYAISLVLAAFMAGLAFGSRHFGTRADAAPRPLRLYGHLELGIAGLGALSFLLIQLAPPVYVWLAHALPAGGLGVLRAGIAVVVLVPPTFLMGGTLPVLSRFVVRSRRELGTDLGVLYAVNTFGAVLGAFLAGYVLIAAFGVAVSVALAVLLNVCIGIAVLLVDRGQLEMATREDAETLPSGGSPVAPPAELGWVLLTFLFACSGFAALGYEIHWTRALQHFLGNSTYAYSAMLTTFLLGLSVGGWMGGRWVSRVQSPARLLGWVQIGIGLGVVLSVFLLWSWLPRLAERDLLSGATLSWSTYLARRFLVAGAVMLLPTLLIGTTFPIINHIGIHSLARLGHGVGVLYYSNTLGAILGSLLGGFVILPWLGAQKALLVTALLNAFVGILALARARARQRQSLDVAVALLVVFAGVLLGAFAQRSGRALLADTQAPEDVLLFSREDHAAETRVYRKANGELHMSVDGHHIGGTEVSILRKEKILAHLPLALCPAAKRSLSIGLGSGITLGTLALYDQLQRIDCVEIVPGVVSGARYFAAAHGNVLEDPRVSLQVGDGVQFLLTTAERYDIISSDSKLNPEYAGNAPLLARDYYRLCRERLSDNGVMAQWLAVHTPASEVHAIMRSFVESFPHAGVFWYDPYNIVLIGSGVPLTLDVEAVQRLDRPEPVHSDLVSLQLENPLVYAGLFIAGDDALRTALGDGPVNTWMHPRLEFTLIRAYRDKPNYLHETENLQWMLRHRNVQGLTVVGPVELAAVDRFRNSSLELLRAFAAGGGVGRLELGVEHLERAARDNPEDRRADYWIQAVQVTQQLLQRAEQAGVLDSPEALVRAGLAHADAGRNAEALGYYDKALALRPQDSNIQYNRLLALRQLGRQDEFDRALASFLEDFPRDARGPAMQGRALAAQGDFETALRSFRKAHELDPSSAVIVNNIATSLARLERNAEAGEAFEQVLDLDPDFPNAAYFAAASFSKAGRTQEAAHWMRHCLDHGLATHEQFESEGFFANLRASSDWIP